MAEANGIVGSGSYTYRVVGDWAKLPAGWTFRDVAAALRAVANAAAQGEITSAQGLRLVRLYTEIYRYL